MSRISCISWPRNKGVRYGCCIGLDWIWGRGTGRLLIPLRMISGVGDSCLTSNTFCGGEGGLHVWPVLPDECFQLYGQEEHDIKGGMLIS